MLWIQKQVLQQYRLAVSRPIVETRTAITMTTSTNFEVKGTVHSTKKYKYGTNLILLLIFFSHMQTNSLA